MSGEATPLLHSAAAAPRAAHPTRPYRALFRKQLTLQGRRRLGTLCQLLVPIIFLSLGLIFQYIFDVLKPPVPDEHITPPVLPLQDPLWFTPYFEYYLLVDDSVDGNVGFALSNGTAGGGLLGQVTQRVFQFPNESISFVPYFVPHPSETEAMTSVRAQLDALSTLSLHFVRNMSYSTYYDLPTGVVDFFAVDPNSGRLSYSMRSNDNPDYIRIPKLPKSTRQGRGGVGDVNPLNELQNGGINVTFPRAVAISNLHVAFAQWCCGITITPSFTGFPFQTILPDISVMGFLSIGMFPYALSFLLPMLLYMIVKEREDGLLQLMESVGLRLRHYWVVFYVFSLALFVVVLAVFLGFGFALQMRFFAQTNMLVFLLVALVWGITLVSMSAVLSLVFSNARTASIFGYLCVIIVTNFAIFFNYNVYRDTVPTAGYLVLPPFAFYRALYVMSMACLNNRCMQLADLPGSEIPRCVLALLLETLVLNLVLAYASFVSRRGCCWCFAGCCRRRAGKPRTLPLTAGGAAGRGAEPTSPYQSLKFSVDDDVVAEASRVASDPYIQQRCPVVISDVHKFYGKKHANRGVTLAVDRGECFGLLGPNGAGKTTLIGILVGLLEPSSGSVYIAGHSLSEDSNQARLKLGICPQHDRLWEELTVREHVLFYARLKGVPPGEERAHVDQLIGTVDLAHVADRRASDLSGGMKRRLSVAMSLAGPIDVVFLDEPTTGLDPVTRRQLWDVIRDASQRCSMLITTHRMDEADALCSRIAIMSDGRIRCIGQQQHLKHKFGNGYSIRASYAHADDFERVDRFVRGVVPTATCLRTSLCSALYQIPSDQMDLAAAFRRFQEHATSHAIKEYSISQTSLEDVFTNVIMQASGA